MASGVSLPAPSDGIAHQCIALYIFFLEALSLSNFKEPGMEHCVLEAKTPGINGTRERVATQLANTMSDEV